METLRSLIPMLTFLASTLGAGTVAFALFSWLRRQFPLPVDGGRGVARLAFALLYAPRYARWSVLVLSALISAAATASLTALNGGAILPAVDTVLAASLSAIMSQVMHSIELPTVPQPEVKP